ncbi:MAG: ABC transporter ATP-binding protein [Pirellulales bacterium]
MPALLAESLVKTYPTRGEPLSVLRGVDLRLEPRENTAVLGPSGSGKSTLLYILGTLDTPTGGKLELLGEDPTKFDEARLADFRHRRIGFVFQEHYLLPQCSALENVLLPVVAGGGVDAATHARGVELLDRVGLASRRDHRPAELSGGERQRTAIARALLMKPALLLADEPTGNLDRKTAESIGKLLLELQKSESTMLIAVTHSLELAAMFQRRHELDDGKLIERT